MSHSKADSGGG